LEVKKSRNVSLIGEFRQDGCSRRHYRRGTRLRPELRTRIVAGNDGVDRRVLWAHHTDSATPWDWHDPGDMVLTSGAIVPAAAEDQVQFIGL
jgi:Purine catabolism regulatory protein-like family